MSIDIANIIWRNVSDNLIPYFFRDIRFFRSETESPEWFKEYVFCIMNELSISSDILFENSFDTDKKLKFTSQVGVLEILLNDEFDNILRRIFYSDDFSSANNIWSLYNESETNPDPFDLYEQGEIDPDPISLNIGADGVGDVDFTINVPSGLAFNQQRMESLLNDYKPAAKRYEIVTF